MKKKSPKKYRSETFRKLNKRLFDQKMDLLQNSTLNALVIYQNSSGYNLDLRNAVLFQENHLLMQKCIESFLTSEFHKFMSGIIQHISFPHKTTAVTLWDNYVV